MHIDELVERWMILDEERDLIAGKRDATRLGFAILLKFYTQHGRFPRGRSELPDDVVEHVAKQVRVPASEPGFYEKEWIEPPAPGRISRIVASALHNAEVAWSVRIASRLSPETTQRIYALVGIDDASRAVNEGAGDRQEPTGETPAEDDGIDSDLLALIRSAPGNVSLESMMTEIRKLAAVRDRVAAWVVRRCGA